MRAFAANALNLDLFDLQVVKKMRKKLSVVQLRRAARKPFKKVITVV